MAFWTPIVSDTRTAIGIGYRNIPVSIDDAPNNKVVQGERNVLVL